MEAKKIVLRVREDTGEFFVLKRYPDTNKFELCDPALGEKESKKRDNQKKVDRVEEAIALILVGFSPRMYGLQTEKYNRISPEKVVILDVPE